MLGGEDKVVVGNWMFAKPGPLLLPPNQPETEPEIGFFFFLDMSVD